MDSDEHFIMSKSEETKSHNFIRTVLELSGYKVMKFGIENHNQDILKEIKSNYSNKTNCRLMSMPDLVIVDPETHEASIVEIKHRNFKEDFNMKDTDIIFHYSKMKKYLELWRDATLILTFNVRPYCVCVDFDKINWNNHFKGKIMGNNGNLDELWNFSGLYQLLNDRFPRVTKEFFNKALNILK